MSNQALSAITIPVDHPLIGAHSARVIFPQSDSQLQSQSLSHNNIDQFEAIAMVTAITWLTMQLLVKLVKEGLWACLVFVVRVFGVALCEIILA